MMAQAGPPRLTPQQQACVTLLLDGLTDREIAERLGISAHTVGLHLQHARSALGGDGQSARWWVKMAHALGYARWKSDNTYE